MELISGNAVSNVNISANMLRSKFYVCPVCGNSIHSMGEAVIQCHGIMLKPCQAEKTDENVPSVSPQIGKQARPFLGIVVLVNGSKFCMKMCWMHGRSNR